MKGELKPSTIKTGIEYKIYSANWYIENTKNNHVKLFQIGYGIAGDFPICIVSMFKICD
jgi:deoxyhypusine synthase